MPEIEPHFAPKVSLVVTTIGRVRALERLLRSLRAQSYQNFEVLVTDQSGSAGIRNVLDRFTSHLAIEHIDASGLRGASLGRNLGLARVRGDIVAFPDDDCWYSEDVLAQVTRWFGKNPDYDGLCGRSIDLNGNLTSCRWDEHSGDVDKYNVWRRAIGSTIFLQRRVVERVGKFALHLGPGAASPWQCGEETDFLLRALAYEARIYYTLALNIYHLDPVVTYDRSTIQRAKGYGPGYGYVLRRHKYDWKFVFKQWLRPLGGASIGFLKGNFPKARYHWVVFYGRLRGWFSLHENPNS